MYCGDFVSSSDKLPGKKKTNFRLEQIDDTTVSSYIIC
jgi:hypothetical protein